MACEIGNRTVLKFDTEDGVAVALARYIADLSERFIKEKGSFNVVLSGGSLIDTMRYLARAPYKESVDWPKRSIFWLDERVVPLDSKDSNYRLAWDGLLKYVTSY
nr:probable 6-phosphogluconolactonase 4, chloroplastic isoform X2 [Coffea arabica]XP_027085505.1 probable 6-phosphogluconolactonase 4, chloroplastic isoform X2 [Coffea arabica]